MSLRGLDQFFCDDSSGKLDDGEWGQKLSKIVSFMDDPLGECHNLIKLFEISI